MKPTQYTIIHVLLGMAVLTAIALFCVLLAHDDPTRLARMEWAVFLLADLALVLAAFGPSLMRRLRHTPRPAPMSAADVRFCVAIALIGSTLACIGVVSGMSFLLVLGIMLAPMSFIFRPFTPPQR